jgi:GTP-binding protein EngB required for normal cell division
MEYKVDGDFYPRKVIKLFKGDVIKLPEKPKQQLEQVIINKIDKIGKAANNPHVKQLMNNKTPDYQAVETMTESLKPSRKIKKVVKMNPYSHTRG